MLFVLIVITHMAGNSPDIVAMQTFASKSACEIAMTWVLSATTNQKRAICVPYE